MSDLRRRIFATTFSDANNDDVIVDFGSFIERLLLFDTYVLHSRALQEIPHLVQRFGLAAVTRLFKSKAIELSLDISMVGFMDEAKDPYIVDAQTFQLLQPRSTEKSFSTLQQKFDSARLDSWRQLRSALRRALRNAPPTSSDLQQAPLDLISDVREAAVSPGRMAPYVRAALERANIDHRNQDIRFTVSLVDDKLAFETDLERLFRLSPTRAGKIIRDALMGLSGEISRVHEMRLYNALTPFSDPDTPLFGAHLDHAVRALHPGTPTGAFYRVVEVKDLPDLRRPEVAETVDLHALLNARRSPEAAAFRQWLWTAADLSDEEIAEQLEYHVASLAKKFGFFLQTPRGRKVRWLIVQGVSSAAGGLAAVASGVNPIAGVVVGAATSPALSYSNAFLLDRVIPTGPENSQPASFVHEGYPSIFKPPS